MSQRQKIEYLLTPEAAQTRQIAAVRLATKQANERRIQKIQEEEMKRLQAIAEEDKKKKKQAVADKDEKKQQANAEEDEKKKNP